MGGFLGTQGLRFVMGGQEVAGYLGGVQQFGADVEDNVDGIANWILTNTGGTQGGGFTSSSVISTGAYNNLTGTGPTDQEFVQVNQTRTIVTRTNFASTFRVDTYQARITTQSSGTGTNPTVLAGTQGQGNVAIGGTETRTVGIGSTSFSDVTSQQSNPNNPVTVMNSLYVEVNGPTALITGSTSGTVNVGLQLTNASTAGDNPITSVVWTSSRSDVEVFSDGEVLASNDVQVNITLTVTDSAGNQDSDVHAISFFNPMLSFADFQSQVMNQVSINQFGAIQGLNTSFDTGFIGNDNEVITGTVTLQFGQATNYAQLAQGGSAVTRTVSVTISISDPPRGFQTGSSSSYSGTISESQPAPPAETGATSGSITGSAAFFPGNDGFTTINVNVSPENGNWNISESSNVISLNPRSGTGDGSVTVSYNGNNPSSSEQANGVPITLTASDDTAALDTFTVVFNI